MGRGNRQHAGRTAQLGLRLGDRLAPIFGRVLVVQGRRR